LSPKAASPFPVAGPAPFSKAQDGLTVRHSPPARGFAANQAGTRQRERQSGGISGQSPA